MGLGIGNLYLKMENILAFNDGIELLKDKDIDLKMNKLIQRNNIQFGLTEFLDMYIFNKSEFCLV